MNASQQSAPIVQNKAPPSMSQPNQMPLNPVGVPPGAAGALPLGGGKPSSSNIYGQLEQMMAAVKKEAASLDAMKAKIRDLEDIKNKRMPETLRRLEESEGANDLLRRKCHESELQIDQLRNDMQHLNDIYNDERRKHGDSQQLVMQQEQDMDNMRREIMHLGRELQKAGELRNHNQNLQQQIEQLRVKCADEADNVASAKRSLDQQTMKTEKVKADMTSHILQLTEEVRGLKKEARAAEDERANLKEANSASQAKIYHMLDRAQMLNEDYRLTMQRKSTVLMSHGVSAAQMEAQVKQLKEDLLRRDAQLESSSIRLASVEESRTKEKIEGKARLNEANEIISKLRLNIDTFEVEISDLRHQMNMITADRNKYIVEVENFKKQAANFELNKTQKDLEIQREIQSMTLQRDDAVRKATDVQTQFDALHAQIREMQDRHWEDLQKQKEVEARLIDEVEKLAKELDDVSTRLLAAETDKSSVEEYVKNEVGNAGKMVSTLKSELEKRLEELTSVRKEKDVLQAEKDGVLAKVADMDRKMKHMEDNFQKTIEADRQKLKQEVRAKMNRLSTLESEKQELLGETAQLMSQVGECNAEVAKFRNETEESKKALQALNDEYHKMKTLQAKTCEELSTVTKREAQLKEHYAHTEKQFKEDIARLDDLVKSSKKTAAQQVADISSHSKSLNDELEAVRRQNIVLTEAEKRYTSELNAVRAEHDLNSKTNDEMQQKMSKEVTTYKRELQDLKSKLQLMNENKNRMEMEIMTVRVELTKAESELTHMKDVSCKDLEHKASQASDQVKRLNNDLEAAQLDNRKYKMQVVELEEAIATKGNALEKLNKECNRIRREETTESKKLKLQLSTNEQKLHECGNVISMLQKELSDNQVSYHKLQTTSNQTISGLLEELRNTEDLLSAERKKTQTDFEASHAKIAELQSLLERAKENIEETSSKSKQERSDKELRMQQLEQEIDRMRFSMNSKDSRIAELEKARQDDRLKAHELREAVANQERLLSDSRTNVELEQSQRHRLETRIQQLEQELLSLAAAKRPRSHAKSNSKNFPASSPMLHEEESSLAPSVDASLESLVLNVPPPAVLKQTFKNNVAYTSNRGKTQQQQQPRATAGETYDDSIADGYDDEESGYNGSVGAGGSLSNSSSPSKDRSARSPRGSGSGINSSAVDRVTAQLSNRLGKHGDGGVRNHGQRPSSGYGAADEELEDDFMPAPVVERRKSPHHSDGGREEAAEAGGGGGDSVEESILRTQKFLQRKMAGNEKSISAIDAANAALSAYNGSASKREDNITEEDEETGGVEYYGQGGAAKKNAGKKGKSSGSGRGEAGMQHQYQNQHQQREDKENEFEEFRKYKQHMAAAGGNLGGSPSSAAKQVQQHEPVGAAGGAGGGGGGLQYFEGGRAEEQKASKPRSGKKRTVAADNVPRLDMSQQQQQKETLQLPRIGSGGNVLADGGGNSRGSSRGHSGKKKR